MTYIAYGSNLSVSEMKKRCPEAVALGTAWLQGWMLQCRGAYHRAYLTLERRESSAVPVVVWQILPEDEQTLDEYEDYPKLYYKVQLQVEYLDMESGQPKKTDSFLYLMNEDDPLAVPTEEYMAICAAGYAEFHFPQDGLTAAYQRAVDAVNRSLSDPEQSQPSA